MILRPVRPASPFGPPISNRPVGLMRVRTCEVSSPAPCEHGSDDLLDRPRPAACSLETCGACWVESTTVCTDFGHDALVADGDLGLAVGAQVVERAVLAHLGEALGEPVREPDRQRHVLRGLGGGVAEHDALVAGALAVEVVDALLGARLERVVDALGDVGRLRADRDRDAALAAVEADVGRVVADLDDACRARARGCRRSPSVVTSPATCTRPVVTSVSTATRLCGSTREQRVEDAVGDLVADLVGVPLGDGFGGEEAQVSPWFVLSSLGPSRHLRLCVRR